MSVLTTTYWWNRAKSREAAIATHCEETIRRAERSIADPDERDFVPTFDDYRLWESAGVDWQRVRDRVRREVSV